MTKHPKAIRQPAVCALTGLPHPREALVFFAGAAIHLTIGRSEDRP